MDLVVEIVGQLEAKAAYKFEAEKMEVLKLPFLELNLLSLGKDFQVVPLKLKKLKNIIINFK